MPRDTSTGTDAERTVVPALERGGYSYVSQYKIRNIRPNNKNYVIDYIAKKGCRKIGVELKWQQYNGTAEEKIVYTIICLLILVQKNIVLGTLQN